MQATRKELGRRNRSRIAAPQPQTSVRNHKSHTECGQYLRQTVAGQTPKDHALDHPTQDADAQRCGQQCSAKAIAMVQRTQANVRAKHKVGTMRQIGNAHEPEDKRKPRRQREQHAAQSKAVQALYDPEGHQFNPEARNAYFSMLTAGG